VLRKTYEEYEKRNGIFQAWAKDRNETISTMIELDISLELFIQEKYDEEGTRGERQKCVNTRSALMFYTPEATLLRSKRALKGWDKLVPAKQRPPIGKGLALLLADSCYQDGRGDFGAALLMAFDCYLRVSEIVNMMKEDITFPTSTSRGGVRLAKTKTGRNQSVLFKDQWLPSCYRGKWQTEGQENERLDFQSCNFQR
jgi:integrase